MSQQLYVADLMQRHRMAVGFEDSAKAANADRRDHRDGSIPDTLRVGDDISLPAVGTADSRHIRAKHKGFAA